MIKKNTSNLCSGKRDLLILIRSLRSCRRGKDSIIKIYHNKRKSLKNACLIAYARVFSTNSQMEWKMTRWDSWMRAVLVDAAMIAMSLKDANWPPVPPVTPMVTIPMVLACLTASRTFLELPLVEIAINTSPFCPKACN